MEETADQLESSWHSTKLGLGETLVHALSDVLKVPIEDPQSIGQR